ncbi:hypothetical protein GALMADRAFT_231330 [Galerina marginata CBS 339.88]|uniref:mannan endo-1,4-beta-mannosidase n=1 Tax=Galerina marginata (strain CBS 339.88) TaxID=685588 RepID=A0A067SBW4_GALM3|nr:hypothetical protein GALMADRAFT_231330 [Galerina marginata CBS 339.88]
MRIEAAFVVLAVLARQALATPLFGQCGGTDFTGATACVAGSTCTASNENYSHYNADVADIANRAPAAATGFVRASGTGFTLNGKPFFFGGTNALSSTDLNSLFSQMNSAGLHVLRIFAWSDVVGSSSDALQTWSGSTNTPNAAAFAKHMDPIVNAAVANNIRLVVPMIGNWGPSISLYIQQIVGSSGTHDTFYSNAKIVAAYKKYISFFVNRYKTSPGIFAWELMNEPRCTGDDNRGASSACNTALITNWAKQISSYIKSLDSNHMVTMGDEGWFTAADGFGSTYPYQGGEGIDWTNNLKISTIDYGTIHLYPGSWGQTTSWGNTWISQHMTKAKSINKPVVLEEFGTASSGRQAVVQGWLNTALSSGFAGFQYWQFVASFPSGYKSPDDGNGISTSEATFSTVKSAAASMNAKN